MGKGQVGQTAKFELSGRASPKMFFGFFDATFRVAKKEISRTFKRWEPQKVAQYRREVHIKYPSATTASLMISTGVDLIERPNASVFTVSYSD